MSTHKTVTLDNIKQLIDINGDATNFKANFTVTAPNGDTFYMLVVDQNKLDSGEELQYRQVQGSESGSIMADKNVYQNYYLVLKSDRQIPVEIHIDFEQLPLKELEFQPKPYNPPQLPPQQQAPATQVPTKNLSIEKKGVFPYWKWILIAAVLIIGGFFLYKFYMESQKNKDVSKSTTEGPVQSSTIKSPSPVAKSPSPVLSSPSMNQPGKFTFGRVPTASKYY
jgi:hypothetical protein